REDRREGNGRNDCEERGSAEVTAEVLLAQGFRELRGGRVAAGVLRLDGRTADERRRAEPESRGEQVERADDADGPEHTLARGLGRGHGVEPDQNVRQAGGAEYQRKTERQQIDL